MLEVLYERVGNCFKRLRGRPARRTSLGVLALEVRSVPSAVAVRIGDPRSDSGAGTRGAHFRESLFGNELNAPRSADDVYVDGRVITGENFTSVNSSRSSHGAGGGGGAGKVSFQDLSFTAGIQRSANAPRIGGNGRDILIGGAGDDVLVGGATRVGHIDKAAMDVLIAEIDERLDGGRVENVDFCFTIPGDSGAGQSAARRESIIIGDLPNATPAGTLIPVKVKHNV